jgi:acetyl esterase/lipase
VDDLSVGEGNGGLTPIHVTLHLTGASRESVRVDWKTTEGTAVSGEDYQAESGVAEFAPGETSHQITLQIVGDTKPEEDERFGIALSNPVNATVGHASSTVVITNDDATSKDVNGLGYGSAASQTLDLHLPVVGTPPYPVIVWVPGFISYDSDTSDVPALRETLRGYAVAVVRYRNPSVARFPAQIDDLKSAVRWLRANSAANGLDPQRIVAWGNGAGAHLAALLGTAGDFTPPVDNAAFSSAVNAVIDWNGASDLTSLNADAISCNAIDHDAASSPESILIGCGLKTCASVAILASPINDVTAGDAPFLLMHAGFDCYIAPDQSRKLSAALSHAGVNAELHVYNGVAHVDPFWHSGEAFAVVDAFLDGVLKPRHTRGRGVRH